MNEGKMHLGNRFFKHKYMTMDIERSIMYIDTFQDFERMYTDELIDGNILLGDYLDKLLKNYKVTARELAEVTGYNYDYFRKVLRGTRDNPERDFLLAICVYIRATVEETQTLLRYAGQQPLYARRKRDALIWYALMKKHGLTALDIFLTERNYPALKKTPKKDEE